MKIYTSYQLHNKKYSHLSTSELRRRDIFETSPETRSGRKTKKKVRKKSCLAIKMNEDWMS